jgi:hypothetical protein
MAIGPALYSAPFTSISIIVAVAAIGGAAFYLGKFWDTRPDSDERHFGIALVATAAMLFLTAVSWQPLYQIAFAVSALALVVIAMRRLTNLHRKGTFAAG